MSNYTIYSEGIWERILEKYPKIKELTIKLGIKDSQEAKKIREKYRYDFGWSELNNEQRELAFLLSSAEFKESGFLKQVVLTGAFHHQNGASDYAMASFDLVLSDFEDSFRDWYKEIRKRNISENASFSELYDIFLDIIKLKFDYKILYTKLFIRKLLEMSSMPKEDSIEIRNYFLAEDPSILPELKEVLIECK